MSTDTAFEDLVGQIRSSLVWHDPSEEYVRNGGCIVLMLILDEGSDRTPVGWVSKVSRGYWWSTHNRNIVCKYELTTANLTIEECKTRLFNYALGEIVRLYKLNGRAKYMTTLKLRKSDLRACSAHRQTENPVDDESFNIGFHCGADWGVKTQGFPRKPAWACFLVQQRDGSYTWFENEPRVDHNKGRWVADGRSQDVRLHDNWSGGVVRLK